MERNDWGLMSCLVDIPIRLKPGREKSLLSRHLWIFSGAVANSNDIVSGSVHPVVSATGQKLGIAYFNERCSLIGRILSFEETSPEKALATHIQKSISLRKSLFSFTSSTMCRLVHAEADRLPGLIVDLYGDVAVIQIATKGMERLKETIVHSLKEELSLTWIYERSSSSSRKMEGLSPFEGTLWGTEREKVYAEESGILYSIDIKHGQKTGFFLDQREMRSLVQRFSDKRRVLNCFSYSGGFSLAALRGGASSCHSLDVSQSALSLLDENLRLNDFAGTPRHTSRCEDVFDFLRSTETLPYDFVILDPPAFAKKRNDIPNALRGYREINSQVMKKLPQGSLLLTCSCSYFITEDDFLRMVKEASLHANRYVRVITKHHTSFDHPIAVTHPENEYLKSFLLYVD